MISKCLQNTCKRPAKCLQNVINVTNDHSLTSENIATKKKYVTKTAALLALVSYGDETRKELSYFRRELITFTVAVTGLFRANFANLKQLLGNIFYQFLSSF
jgi:hypothetical protein